MAPGLPWPTSSRRRVPGTVSSAGLWDGQPRRPRGHRGGAQGPRPEPAPPGDDRRPAPSSRFDPRHGAHAMRAGGRARQRRRPGVHPRRSSSGEARPSGRVVPTRRGGTGWRAGGGPPPPTTREPRRTTTWPDPIGRPSTNADARPPSRRLVARLCDLLWPAPVTAVPAPRPPPVAYHHEPVALRARRRRRAVRRPHRPRPLHPPRLPSSTRPGAGLAGYSTSLKVSP